MASEVSCDARQANLHAGVKKEAETQNFGGRAIRAGARSGDDAGW